MSTRGSAELARIKLRHPLWRFWQDADGLAAARGSAIVRAATIGELETQIYGHERSRTQRSALARLVAIEPHPRTGPGSDRGAAVIGPPSLPRRDAYTPPDWWAPYAAEFPHWRAGRRARQFWARLPGTMSVHHADDPPALARQIRAASTREER